MRRSGRAVQHGKAHPPQARYAPGLGSRRLLPSRNVYAGGVVPGAATGRKIPRRPERRLRLVEAIGNAARAVGR